MRGKGIDGARAALGGAGIPVGGGDLVERAEHRDLDLVAAVHAGLLPACVRWSPTAPRQPGRSGM